LDFRSHGRIAAAALSLALSAGLAGAQTSPRNASYTLSATLDAANHRITGTGRLTWRNIATVPATELRLHMYWNAWRDPASTWMREQVMGLNPAMAKRSGDGHGSIDLTALSLVDPAAPKDLLPQAHFIAPDDGNAEDRTVLAVPLEQPVPPGGVVDLDFAWTAEVPRTFARTGVLGRYFFIAQWFPKIGVLEDAGWNCHQFHAATEFFADYGIYDVRLTVPTGWIVGATGREASKTDNSNGTTTHRYTEQDVHDFAWTTSPDFVEVLEKFEEPGLPPVDLRVLLQPEHAEQADRHVKAVRAALKHYGTWFGPYTYGHLTVVDPVTVFNAVQGGATSGMEYPTLITAGTRWVVPWSESDPESVTIHEAGHQFLYGLVGTNEFEHAWMDEGLNTYASARVMAEAFPNRFATVERYFGGLVPWPYLDVPWSRDVTGNRLATYRLGPSWDAQSTPTWRDWPGAARFTTYAKTALWMTSLERLIGWNAMQRTLSAFFTSRRFTHPTPDAFFMAASSASGRDLTWFFDAVHRSAASFDYAVEQVTSQAMDDNAVHNTVTVRRRADGVFPVDVLTTFDDGTSIVDRWDGADRWRAFQYDRRTRVRSVEIDPDRVLTLDLNYTNNSWTARPRAAEAAKKWALRWLTWLQTVMLTYAFYA
jgi:hypothetical protein